MNWIILIDFRPSYGTKMALIALVDDLPWEIYIDYGIVLDYLLGFRIGGNILL